MTTAALQPVAQAACQAANEATEQPASVVPDIEVTVITSGLPATAGKGSMLADSCRQGAIASGLLLACSCAGRMDSFAEPAARRLGSQQRQKAGHAWPVYVYKEDLITAMKDGETAGALVGAHQLDTAIAAAPESLPRPRLTEDDLVQWFSDQCYPGKAQRIGMEWEQFVFHPESGRRADTEVVQAVLQGLVDRCGWQPLQDKELGVVSARKDGHLVDFETGGQLELSAPPVDTVWEIAAQMEWYTTQLDGVLKELGLVAISTGRDPINSVEDVPLMPRERALMMWELVPQIGTTAKQILKQTCAIQVSLDYTDEADMVRKLRVGLGLQPLALALSACSPFVDGKPGGFLSQRAEEYRYFDNSGARIGDVPIAFDKDMSFARYVRHVMDIPLLWVKRKGGLIPCLNQKWADLMQGRLPALPGSYPTMADWQMHLGTTWPEVRVKNVLEMRGTDAGSPEMNLALVAFWVGLLYCPKSLAAAEELVCSWTAAERDDMYRQAPKLGLRTPLRNGTLRDIAQPVLAWAREGLVERGHGEEVFLKPLECVVATGRCPADDMLEAFYSTWGQSVAPVFSAAKEHDCCSH